MSLQKKSFLSITHILSKFTQVYQTRTTRLASQYFKIDDNLFGLTTEEQQLKEAIFNFAQKEIAPKAVEIDKSDVFKDMKEVWKSLGDLGALGVTVSPKYGGTGGNYLQQFIITEELSRASGAVGMSYGAHSNLCVNQISRNGSEQQKETYLPKLCSGEHVGALAMSETSSGSDVVSMNLRAVKHDGHYILNGSKFWITNAPDADIFVVYARTDPNAGKKAHGITAFIVEKGMKGFYCSQKLDKLGMRGCSTGELVFEDVKVPESNILGKVNKGIYVLFSGLDIERLILSAGATGVMQAACDTAFQYVHTREQFGQTIGTFQLMQAKIADMYKSLASTRSYAYNVATAIDRGVISSKDSAALFLLAGENCVKVALEAVQCLGGNGVINDSPTGRYLRDAKLFEIGGGTSEIRRLVIGRALNMEYTK